MFSKYTILFALLAVFAVQSATALNPDNYKERGLNDLINKAKESITRLRNLIRDTIAKALERLNEIKDAIVIRSNELLAKIKADILAEVEKVKEQIQRMKDEAVALGIDVKECIVENRDLLEQIPLNIITRLIDCVNNEVNKIKDIVISAIDEIVAIKDKLVNLPSRLKKCIGGLRPVKCIGNLIGDVVTAISSLPASIQEKVSQIVSVVVGLEASLQTCAVSKVLETAKEAAIIGARVAQCVAGKIRE